MNATETLTFKKAILGGFFLFIVGFVIGEKLIALPLTNGGKLSFSELSGEARALFFCMNILVKGSLLWFYTRWAMRHDLFHVRFAFSKRTWVVVVICLVLFSTTSLAFPQMMPSFSKEWSYYNRLYGFPFGPIDTILQYVYYVFEGLVMIWITDAFQTASEIKFRGSRIPWGGIALGLLWGSAHIFSKGLSTALLWALPFGIITGICYLVDRKSFWSPFLFWMIYNIV